MFFPSRFIPVVLDCTPGMMIVDDPDTGLHPIISPGYPVGLGIGQCASLGSETRVGRRGVKGSAFPDTWGHVNPGRPFPIGE